LCEGRQGDRIQRNRARIAVLGSIKVDLAALEVDLVPEQAVLLGQEDPLIVGRVAQGTRSPCAEIARSFDAGCDTENLPTD
jgi:hypothetical protein